MLFAVTSVYTSAVTGHLKAGVASTNTATALRLLGGGEGPRAGPGTASVWAVRKKHGGKSCRARLSENLIM